VSCLSPLAANRCPETGAVWIGSDPTRSGRPLQVPCGKCIGCRLDRARAWSVRIVHEAKLYRSNWFATFTYRDEDLPKSCSLEYPDFQAMMKRLRERVSGDEAGPKGGHPLRFFVAGEYGSARLRPHFHAVLFNLRTGDETRLQNESFRSSLLEEVWRKGTVDLRPVTPQRASYVSGYALKKVRSRGTHYEDVVDTSTGELLSRRKEFVEMSRRPGIGAWFYEKFAGDLFPVDYAVVEGKRNKVPRYYWEKFRLLGDPADVERIEEARVDRAELRRDDSTPERRLVRAEYLERMVAASESRLDL